MAQINPPAPPLNTHQARELFFSEGRVPAGLIDHAILDSWRRCAGLRRPTQERIGFNVYDRAMVEQLQFENQALIEDFEATLGLFSQVLNTSGFHPVFTNAKAVTIARFCDPRQTTGALYHALQLGSDMSESAIGTAAMNCALAARRPVQVFGDEHYFEANASFSCAAAPVFGIDGRLIGAVNLTKHRHGREFGALSLAESCATTIEHRQLRRLPAQLSLRISWTANGESRNATVAFGKDGEVLGMTREASKILNPVGQPLQRLNFEQLFEGRFGPWMDRLARTTQPQPIRLNSGLFVFIERQLLRAPPPPLIATVSPAPQNMPYTGDPAFAQRFQIALRALHKELPVLIRGETGSGKEVTARALHREHCPDAAFVAINCAALPEALIESELFGYSDGAFTGSRRGGASGRIEEADGGTLFLDEIGDMPLALQARLLRVLDTREVTRLGNGKARKVSFNLMCATHQDLEALISSGQFRADLFYRIAGITLTLAPLRERAQLAGFFDTLAAQECAHTHGITPQAMTLLLGHGWPGNAREAVSVLKRALLLCESGEPLSAEHVRFALPQRLCNHMVPSAITVAVPEPLPTVSERLTDLEAQAIAQALRSTHGNVSLAAEHLGISRSTLQRRIRSSDLLLRMRNELRP